MLEKGSPNLSCGSRGMYKTVIFRESCTVDMVGRYAALDSMIRIRDRHFDELPWEGRDEAIRCRDRLRQIVDNISPHVSVFFPHNEPGASDRK